MSLVKRGENFFFNYDFFSVWILIPTLNQEQEIIKSSFVYSMRITDLILGSLVRELQAQKLRKYIIYNNEFI